MPLAKLKLQAGDAKLLLQILVMAVLKKKKKEKKRADKRKKRAWRGEKPAECNLLVSIYCSTCWPVFSFAERYCFKESPALQHIAHPAPALVVRSPCSKPTVGAITRQAG